MISVLLLDEHRVILHALKTTLENEQDVVVCAATPCVEEALRIAEQERPDVIVTEVILPNRYGLDVTETFCSIAENVRVILYSVCDENIYARRALASGASGYVMKSEPTRTVVEAIRAVVDGEIYLSASASSRLLTEVLGTSSEIGHVTDLLTNREMTVFHLIGKGHALSEIATQLNITRKTVESYRRQIRDKLALDNTADLLRMAVSCIDASAARHYESASLDS